MSGESGYSHRMVTVCLLAVVLLLGWAAMANAYIAEAPELSGHRIGGRRFRRAMMLQFCWNGVRGLSDIPGVISYAFREKIGIPIGMGIAAAAAIGFEIVLRRTEESLKQPFKRRR